MFATMSARQSDAVNALIDSLRPGWKQAYVYAEFDDDGDDAESLSSAFVVDPPPAAPSPRSFPLDVGPVLALGELYKAYRDAGHGFGQLELHVMSDHRYRFTFHERADRWPRSERGARIDARAAELLAEAAPPRPAPAPPPASPRPPRPPLPLQASTREDLAQMVTALLHASAHAAAAAAVREGRPIVARWFRSFARGHVQGAGFMHSVHGLLPPLSTLAPPDDIAAGSTLENIAAAHAAEVDLAATCAAMHDRSPEHPKVADVFSFIQHARIDALDALRNAQERVARDRDLGDTGPLFVCARCGRTHVIDALPCFVCEADRFVAVT